MGCSGIAYFLPACLVIWSVFQAILSLLAAMQQKFTSVNKQGSASLSPFDLRTTSTVIYSSDSFTIIEDIHTYNVS